MNQRLSASDLTNFRSLLAREAGLRFGDDRLPDLAGLLATRMSKTKSSSASAYLDRARASSDELGELARALSVSETYFLRNREQFDAFEALLLARQATETRHLRLLSAGCCSGEEAYSLAITIHETLLRPNEWNISILGVDLNPDSIEKAMKASYARWSLRVTPDAIRTKYFRRVGGHHVVADEVRKLVRFERGNLVKPAGLWTPEAFDFVFCRNVLIYLTREAAREVVQQLARCLVPNGYLFLGHAENLRGISNDFHLEHSHGSFYYRRRKSLENALLSQAPPPRPEAAPAPTDTSWFDLIARASQRIENLSHHDRDPTTTSDSELVHGPPGAASHGERGLRLAQAMVLIEQERFDEALRLIDSRTEAPELDSDALLVRTMLLVSTGQLATAEEIGARLLATDNLNAGAHYAMAICREHAGDLDQAVEHSRAAVYLDAEFAMPHLHLGRLARRAGDLATARRELALARALFSFEDSARIVLFGGGFGRAALQRLCQAELEAVEGAL